MLASEAFPYAKTGGLADVLAALPEALAGARRRGHRHAARLPRRAARRPGAVERLGRVRAPGVEPPRARRRPARRPARACRRSCWTPRATSTATGSTAPAARDYPDNAERFAFFCRAALEWLPQPRHARPTSSTATTGRPRSLRRCCAPTAALYPELRRDASRCRRSTISPTRAASAPTNWHLLNLDARYFTRETLEFYGDINFLKAGLVFADVADHREPALRARDPDTRARRRPRRRPARARRTAARHPERHRLPGLEPGRRPALPARYDAGDLGGKARLQGRPAGDARAQARRRGAAARRRLAPRLAEGHRRRPRRGCRCSSSSRPRSSSSWAAAIRTSSAACAALAEHVSPIASPSASGWTRRSRIASRPAPTSS